jgi:hypothetical protein
MTSPPLLSALHWTFRFNKIHPMPPPVVPPDQLRLKRSSRYAPKLTGISTGLRLIASFKTQLVCRSFTPSDGGLQTFRLSLG